VTVNGDTYAVSDGEVSLPDARAVEVLADAYGVTPDALGADTADVDVCGAELSAGGTCDRPAGECPYH
jgi:hypothetical protein